MKRVLRALLAPLFFALIGIGLTAPAASADIDTDNIMRATVWVDVSWEGIVEVPYADDTTEKYTATAIGYCTGFIVSPNGHIATAGHCVRYDEGIRRQLIANVIAKEKLAPTNGQFDVTKLDWRVLHEETPTIRIGQPSVVNDAVFENEGITAQLLNSQDFEGGDNALVQVAGKNTEDAVLQIANQTPKVRDRVTAVGFPSDTAGISEADRQSPTFKEGSISAQTVSKKGVPQLQLDGELITGMSGGPTLNSAGEVVGINSSGFTDRNQSYITDTATLRTFLEQNGVKLTTNTSDSPSAASAPQPAAVQPAQQSDNTPWPLYIVGGLVIAGLTGFVIYLLKRKPAPVAVTTPTTPATPPNDSNPV